jgi:hypothetical protein
MNKAALIPLIALVGCTKPDTQPPPPVGSVVVQSDYADIKIRYQPPIPPFTEEALAAKVSGTVLLDMTINPAGLPTKAIAISGPEPLRKFSESYAMRFQFEPVLLRGNPQSARFTMPMPILMRR